MVTLLVDYFGGSWGRGDCLWVPVDLAEPRCTLLPAALEVRLGLREPGGGPFFAVATLGLVVVVIVVVAAALEWTRL